MGRKIEYESKSGFKGRLYDRHKFFGEEYYQMSIWNPDGQEIIRAYNASPQTIGELKEVVEHSQKLVERISQKERI